MGHSKDMWLDEQERICERFAGGNLTQQEAHQMLMRLGFDPHEASDMLDEAVS